MIYRENFPGYSNVCLGIIKMCSTEVYGVKNAITDTHKKDKGRPSFVECTTNKSYITAAQISCVDPDMESNNGEDKCDSFKTPPDNFERGIKYYNIGQENFQRCQLGIKKTVSKNTLDSTPCSAGMITLRKINLLKSFNNELCIMATPVVHSRSECSMSDAVLVSDNSLIDCDTALFSSLETARLPTFVPCKKYTDSLCSDDLRLKKLCDPSVYTSAHLRKSAIDVESDSEVCQGSSVSSSLAHSMTSLSLNNHKVVVLKEHSNVTLAHSDISQTIKAGKNCDSFTAASDLTNLEVCYNKQECSEHIQKLPSNAVEFKTPTVPIQPGLILKQLTQLPCQRITPHRSYPCGNISITSFDDDSFSPVHITLPPDSPQESSNFITERLVITSVKATEKEKQNMIISSDCKMHDGDGKVQFESVRDKKNKKKPILTTKLKHCKNNDKNDNNEIKLKSAKINTAKVRNSLKMDDMCESYGQKKTTLAEVPVPENYLTEEQHKRNASSTGNIIRSKRTLRLTTSSQSKDLTNFPNIEQINCSQNPQSITLSEFNSIASVRRSKRVGNTHSTKVNPLEAKNSEIIIDDVNNTAKELKKRKYENVKNPKLANSLKDNNIAFNKAENSTVTQKNEKGGKRELYSSRMSVECNNELTVSNMSQVGEKPHKKMFVQADKSLYGTGSRTLENDGTRRRSHVPTSVARLTGRPNFPTIDSQKLCPSMTMIGSDKEQRKGLSSKSKHFVSKCSPTKPKLFLDDGFENNCEDGTGDEVQSYIHPQSSFSELQSDRINPKKKKPTAQQTQGEMLNSKRQSGKPPKESDENIKSSFDQSFERTSHLEDIKMSQRKRKIYPTVTDERSKLKGSVTTRSKINSENKLANVNALSIQNEHAKVSKHVKKGSKKESCLEVALVNEKTERIIIEEQQDEIAAIAATEKSTRKRNLRAPKKLPLSKNKTQPQCKEDTSSAMKQASQKFVGAHCSIAGGVSNAVREAASIGARAFALFVRNGRTWKLNTLNVAEAEKFKEACKEHGFLPHLILPHGSYLLNCGSSNPETLQKSRDTLIHELQICEMLGLELYNFHPGSACGQGSVDDCLKTVAESINIAHKKTHHVKTVIENMSCQGSTVGGKFEELKAIIDGVKDKSRIGVCLDTCHAFAAGFDLSSEGGFNKCIEDFDRIVGLQYLCAMHLNDSKGELGCHLDRHENIGRGHIGMEGFRYVMNDPRLNNIPMILETPVNDYAKEIKILYELENH